MSYPTMKSKPMGALFGVLALVAILSVAPAFGQTANEVDMAKGAGASQTADCVAANNCFNPNPLTVAPGTQVTWKNTDTVSHTVTSGKPSDNQTGTAFDSGGLIKPGGTFQFTFQNAGTYDYFCIVHPWMTAQVIVGGATMSNMTNTTNMINTTNMTASNNTATPEFGPVAPIVLAIAVISIVVFTTRYRGIPKL
ncbi:MAG: hypothetical protein AUG16_01690 [Thaumarchaeota archaeon 13_1_20CM_2_39_20]|nr:MAG: hypothetical protein AUG16_01690 [Thaumarchaeota archaeon 13_1_20CM_2_39_20]